MVETGERMTEEDTTASGTAQTLIDQGKAEPEEPP